MSLGLLSQPTRSNLQLQVQRAAAGPTLRPLTSLSFPGTPENEDFSCC